MLSMWILQFFAFFGRLSNERGQSFDSDGIRRLFHRVLDAKAAKSAARLHLRLAKAFQILVTRMGVEPFEHPIDRPFN